jgi:hypothetical protein
VAVYSDVRKSIRNVALNALSEFTNPVVIFSHENGPEPSVSYVVINILSVIPVGHHITSTLANENEEIIFSVPYEIQVQFSFIGSQSGDMAQSFTQNINNNPITIEETQVQKLGLVRKSAIRRAPQKRDTKWVEYHNMDVTFNYVVITNQLIDVVEGVVIADETSEIPVIIKIPESIIYP